MAALTAIYRPGPLRANVHKKYVKDKANAENIEYAHPIIEEILGSTFGHVTFQEQFMLLAQKLGGFTPAESDKLRKTLVKKSLDTMGKKGDEREAARIKFVTGAKEINGVPESVSQELWERIEFFEAVSPRRWRHFGRLFDKIRSKGSAIRENSQLSPELGDFVLVDGEVKEAKSRVQGKSGNCECDTLFIMFSPHRAFQKTQLSLIVVGA